jgi:hypothetical protein
VQLVPDAPEEGQRRVGRGLLARRDEPLVGQLAQRAGVELGRGEPHRGVDVPQAARRLLDVRLADVRRGAVAPIALVALAQRRREELGEVAPVHVLSQDTLEPGEEPPVAGEEARLLHGGAAGKVRAGHRHAVAERAQAVTHLQPEVPERIEQLLHHPLHVRRQLSVVHHHEIDVGERMELAPSVAAERHHHQRRGVEPGPHRVVGDEPGEREDDPVHEVRVGADRFLPRRALGVSHLEGVESLRERLPEECEPKATPVFSALGSCLGAPGPAKQLDGHDR